MQDSKRVNAAKGAMLLAGRKVAEKITIETMQQSFPTYYDQHADFINALTNETAKLLNHSFQHAWINLSTKGTFSQFVPLATAFDRIEAEAEASKANGQPAVDTFAKGADPSLTIPTATIPLLTEERDNLRKIRAELAKQRQFKVDRCLKRAADADAKEQRVRAALQTMAQVDQALRPLDKQEHFNLLMQFKAAQESV